MGHPAVGRMQGSFDCDVVRFADDTFAQDDSYLLLRFVQVHELLTSMTTAFPDDDFAG
jgi:hypothetical protein